MQKVELPGWCQIIVGLISEIAKERGDDPEEFQETLLANIRKGKVGTAATVPTPANREHLYRTKEGDH